LYKTKVYLLLFGGSLSWIYLFFFGYLFDTFWCSVVWDLQRGLPIVWPLPLLMKLKTEAWV